MKKVIVISVVMLACQTVYAGPALEGLAGRDRLEQIDIPAATAAAVAGEKGTQGRAPKAIDVVGQVKNNTGEELVTVAQVSYKTVTDSPLCAPPVLTEDGWKNKPRTERSISVIGGNGAKFGASFKVTKRTLACDWAITDLSISLVNREVYERWEKDPKMVAPGVTGSGNVAPKDSFQYECRLMRGVAMCNDAHFSVLPSGRVALDFTVNK